MSGPKDVATPLSYTVPADVGQPGGGPAIKGRENHRFFGVWQDRGSLFAAQGTALGGRTAINWFELRLVDDTVVQAAALSDPCADLLFPSLATDDKGGLALAYTRVSSTELPSIVVSTRHAGDPAGQLRAPLLVVAGTAPYHCSSSPVGWGTYTSTMRDPSDPSLVWPFQEYAASATDCAWQTRWLAVTP